MVDQIAVVTKTVFTNDTTADFTDPSITETFKGAIFFLSKQDDDDTDVDHAILGYGFVAPEHATEDMGFLTVARHGTATQNTFFANFLATGTADSIASSSNGVSFDVLGRYDSTISGGVRIAFSAVGFSVKITAILFAGFSRASIGTITSDDAASTHEDVGDSGVGFYRPDLLVLLTSNLSLGTLINDCAPCLGFAVDTATIQQKCAYVNFDRLVDPTDSDGYLRSDACGGAFDGATRTAKYAIISTFDSTGFNHQATGTTGNVNCMYFALKFSGTKRLSVANMAVAGSTGNQTFSSFGFPPELVLGMGTLLAAEDTLTDGATASTATYFATGTHGSRSYGICNEEGLDVNPTPGNSSSRQGDHALMVLTHLGAVAQQASWVGASSSGFTLNFTTASSAGHMTALGIATGEVYTETETISEAFVSVLADIPTSFGDTETITEGADLFLGSVSIASETVVISEIFLSVLADALAALDTDGEVAQGLAKEGEVFSLGAAEGLVMQGQAKEGEVFLLAAVDGETVTN